jgi:tetratricopeptide (TPR) repeat protein
MYQLERPVAESKQMLDALADFHENHAEVLLAQGKPDQAISSFRQSLKLRGQRLGGRTATQLRLAVLDRDLRASSRYFEPRAIFEYCDTLLRLAALLPAAGRPYEAECMLGEAFLMAEHIIYYSTTSHHFVVLYANTAIAAAERLADSARSDEAERFYQLAAALWYDVRRESSEVEQFRSGLHGNKRDWDWFRETYPDLVDLGVSRESLAQIHYQTAFWSQTHGRANYQNGSWLVASQHFGKAVERRDPPLAADLLQLSMAFSQLGEPGNAKVEYDRAVALIREMKTRDSELESLQRAAAIVLAENTAPKTN